MLLPSYSRLREAAAALTLCAALNSYATEAPDTVSERQLDGLVVTGTRAPSNPSLLSQTVTVIGRADIERSQRTSLLPLINELTPGVFTTSRGVYGYGVSGGAAGGISVRGLTGSSAQVLTLIDGHPQYSGIFGHPISDALQSLMADKVEIVRGPASTLYGSNAMGGVINIITRRMAGDGVETMARAGYGSYNTFETELTNRLRRGRFSSTVSGSYNRSDNNRPDMDFSQYSGFAKLGYDISSRWRAFADVDITQFKASNPGAVSAPLIDADQRITRGAAAIGVDNSYGKTNGGVSVFFNWGHHWINDGHTASADPRAYRFISDDNMAGVSLWQSWQPAEGSVFTAGADWFRYSGRAWNSYVTGPREGESEEIADRFHNEFAGYIDLRQQLFSRLTVSAGVRADHNSGVGTEWIPKGGIALNLPHEITLRASASRGFRYPTIREMYMFPPQNPDLQAERSCTYEAAYSQTLLDGALRYGVNLYYLNASNIIMTLPRTDGPGRLNVNSGKLISRGVELEGSWRISRRVSADLNYSYDDLSRTVAGAPAHKLYGGVAYSHGRLTAQTGLQYVAGLHTSDTPADDRKESFVLWSVRGEFEVCKYLSLWVRGENLLAQHYEINAGFPMPRATAIAGVKVKF